MSLKSVNDILGVLEQQAKWQEQPFQRLLQCWAEIVGTVVAAHTRPLSIQREVLRVATSSAAWAQNLTFGRQTLLVKLNEKLPTPLVDIRFSSAEWRCLPDEQKQQQTILPYEHPSYLGDVSSSHHNVTPAIVNANTAFEHWAKTMQTRSHGLPLCPQCQCPTPPGELQRWQVCSFCAAKQLSDKFEGSGEYG
ncbi:RNA-binding protein [Nostoc minutum NIES-26]|uniref:RNA-binding protein n=1 Tax=Nostoc minutum NIES-26 TaxID=1844469 RepID=A0A367QW74_9NOSO|nr:DciA family protein [Dendronalium sp. ChiSLP03b]MDZ8208861.1 DciA family protein [Dendronalium sp. ChiSLP03b]RCJ27951.1 RNA-binding protein [Nostoc minutum NIES-26]